MYSTGSKLFLGLAGAATVAAVVYGATQGFGALGGVGLVFVILALAGLGAATLYTRDGEVSAMDDAAANSSPAAAAPTGTSMWPIVGALAGLLLVIGTVTDKRYFIAGIVLAVIAAVEWTVEAWAQRATGDATANEAIRGRLLHPLELPIAGAVGLAVIIYGFSRVMLGVDEKASPAVFVVAAALIVAFGALFASMPQLRRSIVGVVCAVGAVVVVAGGVSAAASGERPALKTESSDKTYDTKNRDCTAADETEADKKSGNVVTAKSNSLATLTFDGTKLTAYQIAGTFAGGPLTIDKGNAVNVMFQNDSNETRRLTVYGGTSVASVAGTDVKTPRLFCTRAIRPGKTALLTFKLPKPSSDKDPFYAYIPGHDAARVEIVVP